MYNAYHHVIIDMSFNIVCAGYIAAKATAEARIAFEVGAAPMKQRAVTTGGAVPCALGRTIKTLKSAA
jgi:hypothetical protein